MIQQTLKLTMAAAILAALAACETPMTMQRELPDYVGRKCDDTSWLVRDETGDAVATRQFVNATPSQEAEEDGKTARAILTTPNNDGTPLQNALVKINDDSGADLSSSALIARIIQSDKVNGLGGIAVRSFLNDAANTIRQGNRFRTALSVESTGQLIAYHYVAGGEGCMQIEMTHTVQVGHGEVITIKYRWHIFGDFAVNGRGTNSSDIFGTGNETIAITEDQANARNFHHKLWANHEMFKVTLVERQWRPGKRWKELTHPVYWRLYEQNEESCIDMMFQNPPPQTLPPGSAPPFYCLGRCKNPPIINTK